MNKSLSKIITDGTGILNRNPGSLYSPSHSLTAFPYPNTVWNTSKAISKALAICLRSS